MNLLKKLLLPLAIAGTMENCSMVGSPSQEGGGVVDTALEQGKEQMTQLLREVANGESSLAALTAEQVELLSQCHGSYYCDSLTNEQQKTFDRYWETHGANDVMSVTGGKATVPESGTGSIQIEEITAILTRDGVKIVDHSGIVADSVGFNSRDTSRSARGIN